jgi:RNA polymerase sigma factor (sigma-70 family)
MAKAGANAEKPGARDEPADDVLLERFAARQEQAAFGALVARHGPLVLGVCRRVLRHEQDAEDAFQAVFCVLARKAGGLRQGTAVGAWLYAVAWRIARRAKAAQVRRRMRERQLPDVPAPENAPESVWRELCPILDEEVSRLPERYRRSFVLCHLEGKTYEVAAAELRCAPKTVSSRLTRARKRLRARLTRRGLALSAGMLTTVLSRHTVLAAVRAELALNALRTGIQYAAGRPIAEPVADLADRFLRARVLRWTLAGAGSVVVLLAILLLVAFLLPHAGPDGAPAPAPPAAAPIPLQADQAKLQGNWRVIAKEMGGLAQPDQRIAFAFAGDKFMLLAPGFQGPALPYVLDPAKEPKAIDVNVDVGTVWRGIYELNGDSLKLCLNQNLGGDRPTVFRTHPGVMRVFLYTLRRERAGGDGS